MSTSFEDVETVMDRMFQVPVLKMLEKAEIIHEENTVNLYDPNLIMDVRHSFLRKPLILTNNVKPRQRCSTEVNLDAIRKAREDHLLQLELRRFEKSVQAARPKFYQHKACIKSTIANSDDDEFWDSVIPRHSIQTIHLNDNKIESIKLESSETKTDTSLTENDNDLYRPNIKVTIKDKPSINETIEENNTILRNALHLWREYVKENKRQRELSLKVQQHLANKLLERYLQMWKNCVQKEKILAMKKKEEIETTNEKKIEMFVNAIAKKQEEIKKYPKLAKKDVRANSAPEVSTRPTILVRQVCVVESPAQNRLKAQQKIIEEQKIKLAKQRQIIEDMQLREFQNESKLMNNKTLEAAKEILDYCGPTTKRTLLQLMREKGYNTKNEEKVLKVANPPDFFLRMEARAEARKERVKKAREAREKRLEEEKKREEESRKRQEEERRALQLEAHRKAKRLQREQERQKIMKLEKQRLLIETADQFYQHLLIKRYVLYPFKNLLEIKRAKEAEAIRHYDCSLLKKFLKSWYLFTKSELNAKIQLATHLNNTISIKNMFRLWKESVLETKRNLQVAQDFWDIKLQSRALNIWKVYTDEQRELDFEKYSIAVAHYEKQLLIKGFVGWKRYLEIADELRESERRKEELRALVQTVIPDFDPRQHGVAITD